MAALGEAVAMGLWDLFDDAVGSEHPQLAADAGAEAADLLGRGTPGAGAEEAAQVAVAETGRGEFAAGDGLKQGQVLGVAKSEGAEAPAAVADRMGDGVEEPGARCSVSDAVTPRLGEKGVSP